MWIRSLGREDPPEKEMAIHSSILAWKIPWMEERGRLQSMGSQRVGHDWTTLITYSFSINASNEYSRLISFRMDWLDLLAVQGTLKSLLQHHSTNVMHQFFSAQPSSQSNSHIHTWPPEKTIALTRWTLISKVMSLLLNMLSRLVITFLLRSVFNFMAAVTICSDFGAQKNKVWHCFHSFPIYFPWSDGTRCHDLRFLNVEL